jgi:glutamine synthetase
MAEGATNFTHVFQPLGSVGVRHGLTGQVHNQLFTFDQSTGKPDYKFKAAELLRGETDGSSYPNGGLRSECLPCTARIARL